MAETLAEFGREFAALQKQVAAAADEGENLEHNLGQHRELMVEGFKALGLRIHELRDAGAQGSKLPDFMTDREVVVMVRELNRHRQAAKKDAARAVQLEASDYLAITRRMAALRAGLTAVANTRGAKFSNKILRINRSAPALTALQAEVEAYAKGGNADYEFIANHTGSYAPDWYDGLYNDLLEEELAKSKAVALSSEQQNLAKRLLDLKLMATTQNKAKTVYVEAQKQARLAEQAANARKGQALSDTRKAADEAWQKIQALVDPYAEAMRDAKILVILSHSPDEAQVKERYRALVNIKSLVKAEVDEIKARRIKG